MSILRSLLLFLSLSLPLLAADETPEEFVTELYQQQTNDNGPFFQTKSQALVGRYFAKPLATFIWKDAVTADGEVGAIDFDPLYNSNDPDPLDFKIQDRSKDTDEGTAVVEATFVQHDEPQKIRFFLTETSEGWRITDIRYDNKRSLLGLLKQAYP